MEDSDDSKREEELAIIVSRLQESLLDSPYMSVDDAVRAFPKFADEIRELWSTISLAQLAAQSGSNSATPDEGKRIETIRSGMRLGDFELLEELGRGGMGLVFRARQISLDREVALKLILADRLASDTDRTRFFDEARSCAKLTHPNIVPIFEVGLAEGRPYICMQLVRGKTLLQTLANGPISGKQAASWMSKIASAIAYAHQNNMLHRDIKPSNILIDEKGEPYITDFGLARDLARQESLTQSGAIVGTPAYMSPEQASANKKKMDARSDVFSLGAVLYHAVTGSPPFQGKTGYETIMRVLDHDPERPRAINKGIDRDLEMIILKALQKPLDLRYSSAESLAADLEAYLRDEEIAARSGRFSHVLSRLMRETHHVDVLANWGLLWIWHSLVVFVVCFATFVLKYNGDETRLHYFLLWTLGLGIWGAIFWRLRRRSGPVTFVERQIAHLWGSSMVGTALLFPIEGILGLEVLSLAPVIALFAGTTFLGKAAILTGEFYLQAIALYATAFIMAFFPIYAHLIFGLTTATCFFVPGWKYYQQELKKTSQV